MKIATAFPRRSKIIYLLPGIDGKLHRVKATDIVKLYPSKGGIDTLFIRDGLDWKAFSMPLGTIQRYFGKNKGILN